jgi:hypothetical protein
VSTTQAAPAVDMTKQTPQPQPQTEANTKAKAGKKRPAKKPVSRVRRQAMTERITYGAAALGMAIGPQLDSGPASVLSSVGITALTGACIYNASKPVYDPDKPGAAPRIDGHRLLRACQTGLPVLTGAGLYAASVINPGMPWWELVAPAAWGAVMALLAPITRRRGVTAENAELPTADNADGKQDAPAGPQPTGYGPYADWLAHQWHTAAVAPDTVLTAFEQYRPDRPDFRCVVVAQRGKAVPALSERQLAAAFDMPEGTVILEPLTGSGPGRMVLTALPTLQEQARQADTLDAMWAANVASQGGAAPGVALLRYRAEKDRLVLQVAAPAGKTIHLNHAKLCSAMGVDDPSRLVIETDGVRQGIVSVYRTNPLMNVRKATADDLVMDSKGRINIGVRHDGKPSKVRLWDPDQGALRGITAGATGAGKSVLQLLLLAAEKRSGVVSFVGDLQGGKSLPEADGQVAWFAKDEGQVLGMLLAVHAVMKYRERVSANRADFALNDPWPLLNVTLDEINRLLSHPNEAIKKLAAILIADIQKTGRKVGIGIRLAVQSLHLKDLGDEEAIRQQGKAGMVVLMRTLSSSTAGMGLDGIAPAGFAMENIPARIYESGQIEALFNGEDDEDGQSTAGMAYVFVDGRAEFMRTFRADKTNGRYTDLAELFGDEPPVTLTPEEIAVAGEAYEQRDNPAYFESLLLQVASTEDGGFTIPSMTATSVSAGPAASAPALKVSTLKDQVLKVLADGPKSLKEVRAALPDVAAGSISNTMTALREEGEVEPVSRGVYKLADTDD